MFGKDEIPLPAPRTLVRVNRKSIPMFRIRLRHLLSRFRSVGILRDLNAPALK